MSGALFALTSRTAGSFEMIIVSRVLVGINAGTSVRLSLHKPFLHAAEWAERWEGDLCCAGISMNVQPMYFGESAPKHLRGAISLSSAVFTAFGVVLGQVVGLRYGDPKLAYLFNFLKIYFKCHLYFKSLYYFFKERFWEVRRVGSTFYPVMPFLASSSWWPCRGSQRVPDTCSSTEGTKRPVLMVRMNTFLSFTISGCILNSVFFYDKL